jgi:hypothetical protein
MLVIVFTDDQINSPEFAALDREMPHVMSGASRQTVVSQPL